MNTIDAWRGDGTIASAKIGRIIRIPIAQPDPAIADLLGEVS